jgi:hypothetical protein
MRASSGVLDNQDAKLTELTLLTVRGTLSIIDMYKEVNKPYPNLLSSGSQPIFDNP